MATEAQHSANAANAQSSTGPRTDAGKATSAQNSLKHGLTAKTVLLQGEDEAAYRQMCENIFDQYLPQHEHEKDLLQLAADTQWRLQRCGRLEAAILDADAPDFKTLDIVSKHEARLMKQLRQLFVEAYKLIDARGARDQAEMEQAIKVRCQEQEAEGKDLDPEEIGFVSSNDSSSAPSPAKPPAKSSARPASKPFTLPSFKDCEAIFIAHRKKMASL